MLRGRPSVALPLPAQCRAMSSRLRCLLSYSPGRPWINEKGLDWVAGNLAAIARLALVVDVDDVLVFDLRVDRGVGVWNLDAALIFAEQRGSHVSSWTRR